MGYYVRAFCAAGAPPPIQDVLDFVRAHGSQVRLESHRHESLDGLGWQQVALIYRDGKLPILLEVSSSESPESLARQEIEEFLEFVAEAPDGGQRKRVEDHLRATRFVVAAQLATSDIDDDGYNANGWVMRYFVEHCQGMIQADGEGFYDGDTLIVELGGDDAVSPE